MATTASTANIAAAAVGVSDTGNNAAATLSIGDQSAALKKSQQSLNASRMKLNTSQSIALGVSDNQQQQQASTVAPTNVAAVNNSTSRHHSKVNLLNSSAADKMRQKIITEDLTWNMAEVKSLKQFCLQSIVSNFTGTMRDIIVVLITLNYIAH